MNKILLFITTIFYLTNLNAESIINSKITFNVSIQCSSEDRDQKNISITIIELINKERKILKTLSYTSKYTESFEQNKDYIVRFEKVACIPKEILIITNGISNKRWKKGFDKYVISISLFKQPTDSIIELSTPIPKIQYSNLEKEFTLVLPSNTKKEVTQNIKDFSSFETKTNFNYPLNYDFINLNLNKIIEEEKKMGSLEANEAKLEYVLELGDELDPNKNTKAKIFFRIEKPFMVNTVAYYYLKSDSSIKEILYQWNELPADQNDLNKMYFKPMDQKYHPKQFDLKYKKLNEEITSKLGHSTFENLESKTDANSFRNDTKWFFDRGIQAYLFMFGGDNGWRQIRLIITKK